MQILRAKLYEIKMREQQEAVSSMRKSQVGSGSRSEKIRTYNYKDNRATDHRLNQNFPLEKDFKCYNSTHLKLGQSPSTPSASWSFLRGDKQRFRPNVVRSTSCRTNLRTQNVSWKIFHTEKVIAKLRTQ